MVLKIEGEDRAEGESDNTTILVSRTGREQHQRASS